MQQEPADPQKSSAKGTILDPFTWYETTDFNVTYTNDTVGGLSVMGLNTDYDDSKSPNDGVAALNIDFGYGTNPIRGVNLGGWLVLEPWITPSFFSSYSSAEDIVDEWTLSQKLGADGAKTALEKHYATFITEQDFIDIAKAGLDHVRIPYGYWAVTTYSGDPYVPQVSWRYLLRGIEWARKHGLRVNLDLHGLPGSQNGWNHSGRLGLIGWLNGTDGQLNADRSIEIHDQLSQFFSQARYKNVVTLYGLVNEPKMISLPLAPVLNWTTVVTDLVQKNGVTATIVVGDGFLGLQKWQGQLTGLQNMVLDAHEYVIFNTDQIGFTHSKKINYVCGGWGSQFEQSMVVSTGFGPTLCGEWSQADTDCTQYINNVGVGSRWEGSLKGQGIETSSEVLEPACPNTTGSCTCDPANADPSKYSSQYKQWLMMFAEAQMITFEKGWGWFYWTWDTEAATQWSYKKGMAAGILPTDAGSRDFNCTDTQADITGLPEYY
jgi:glucan 1,3-beta-glucosidase